MCKELLLLKIDLRLLQIFGLLDYALFVERLCIRLRKRIVECV